MRLGVFSLISFLTGCLTDQRACGLCAWLRKTSVCQLCWPSRRYCSPQNPFHKFLVGINNRNSGASRHTHRCLELQSGRGKLGAPVDHKSKKKQPRLYRRYTDLTSAIDLLFRQRIVLLDPASWDDRNDSHFIEEYKAMRGAKSVLALCLSSVGETYHHWRVFCGHSSGVCIEFFQKELRELIKATSDVRHGKVQYMTLGRIKEATLALADLPFLKRYAFRHEAEFRLIYESMERDANNHEIKIPLSIIRGITLSPWLPVPLFDATREILRSIPGCDRIHINRSELISNEEWKQNADRLLGMKPALAPVAVSRQQTPLKHRNQNRRTARIG